jgi:hypothetical protein
MSTGQQCAVYVSQPTLLSAQRLSERTVVCHLWNALFSTAVIQLQTTYYQFQIFLSYFLLAYTYISYGLCALHISKDKVKSKYVMLKL